MSLSPWKSIFSIAAVFLVFDYIFLTKIFNKMWDKQITSIQGSGPDYTSKGSSAVVIMFVYFVMIAASYIFVVKNSKQQSTLETIGYGALLGLAMYGVFDGTNYVLFKDYKLQTVLIDTIYGMAVTSLACYVGSKFL